MQLTPLIAVHMSAALGAIATGPVLLIGLFGAFTLLPKRYLGQLVRGQWLGLV